MKSIGQSLLVAVIFAIVAGYTFDIKASTDSGELILGSAAAVGFSLYWGWKVARSVLGSLLSTSKNPFQFVFKIGAYWCAGTLGFLAIRNLFGTVPLDEYLKVGVSVLCWIGMAAAYLAYRRAADHPLPVAPAAVVADQAEAATAAREATAANVRDAAQRAGSALGTRFGHVLGGRSS